MTPLNYLSDIILFTKALNARGKKNFKRCTKQISLTPSTNAPSQRLAAPAFAFLYFFPERICANRNLNVYPSPFVFTHLVAHSTANWPTSCFPLHCVSEVIPSLPVLMLYSLSLCGCATVGLHCFLSFIITNKTAVNLCVLCDHMYKINI